MSKFAPILAKGIQAYESQEYELAWSLLEQIPASDTENYRFALPYLGRMCLSQGEVEMATEYFKEATERSYTAQAYFELAECYFTQKNYEDAETCLQKVIELDPLFTDGFIRLGMLYQQCGQREKAFKAFEKAIHLDQQAVVARVHFARLCLDNGDRQRALSQLHYVLQVKPDLAIARLLRGDIFQRMGDHRQALVEYCALSDTRDAAIFTRLAQSFEAIGDSAQALLALEKAFEYDPTLFSIGLKAARLREEKRHWISARKLYQGLLESKKHRELACEAIARIDAMFDLSSPEEVEAALSIESSAVSFQPPAVKTATTKELQTQTLPGGRRATAPLHQHQTQSLAPAKTGHKQLTQPLSLTPPITSKIPPLIERILGLFEVKRK